MNLERSSLRIISKYKCPVLGCGKRTLTNAAMCAHICGIHDYPLKHVEWIKLHGIDHFKVCGSGRGCRKPLMEVVERECQDILKIR